MRLNAFLARAGVASRRRADELIKAGRVTVNGEPGQLNTVVGAHDRVEVDGQAGRDGSGSATSCSTSRPASSRPRATRRGGRPSSSSSPGRAARRPGGAARRGHDGSAPAHERRASSRTGSRTRATASRRRTSPRSRATRTRTALQRLRDGRRARRRPDGAGAGPPPRPRPRRAQSKRGAEAPGQADARGRRPPGDSASPQRLCRAHARRARPRRVPGARALRGGASARLSCRLAAASACACRCSALAWSIQSVRLRVCRSSGR